MGPGDVEESTFPSQSGPWGGQGHYLGFREDVLCQPDFTEKALPGPWKSVISEPRRTLRDTLFHQHLPRTREGGSTEVLSSLSLRVLKMRQRYLDQRLPKDILWTSYGAQMCFVWPA